MSSRHRSRSHRWISTAIATSALGLGTVLGMPAALAQNKAQPAAAKPADPSAADQKKALAAYERGTKLFEGGKFDDALAAFRESYTLVKSPNSHLFIPRCLEAKGQLIEAYNEFQAVADEAVAMNELKYADTRKAALDERAAVARKLAFVTPNATNAAPGATLTVNGTAVPQADWGKPIPILPGPVEVVVTNPDGSKVTERATPAAGESPTITVNAAGKGEVTPPPGGSEPNKLLRPLAFVAGGIGVVGFGMMAVTGGMATSTYGDLNAACGAPDPTTGARACPPDKQGAIGDGKTQRDLANVGLAIGVVGVAAGATLFVLSLRGGGAKKEEGTPVSLQVGPGSLGVKGTF